MLVEEKILTLSREGKVKLYIHKPDNLNNVKGVVLLNHGMGEHIERYKDFAMLLANNNYIVYGHNHRGHKDSISDGDEYGYIDTDDGFQTLVDDCLLIVEMIKKEYPNLPIFLFGHSMGSFVVQRFSQLHGKKINGIILCGSAKQATLPLNFGIFYAKLICKLKGARYRSKKLHDLTFSGFNKPFKPNRTKLDWLNRDEAEVDKYISDPYCGGIFSASFYRDFFKGLKEINHNFELIPKDLPIYIISGSMDPVGGLKKLVLRLYNTLRKQNIKNLDLKLYEDARHELMVEKNREEVMEDCLNWLNNNSNLCNI